MAKEPKNPSKRTTHGVQLISENAINNLKEALVGKLAPYKRPRRIAWVKHLPVNSAGKLNRNPDALTGLVLSTLHYTR